MTTILFVLLVGYLGLVFVLGIVSVMFWGILGLKYRPFKGEPQTWPSVAIVCSAFNEELVIEQSLQHLVVAIRKYPGCVVVMIANDGSTDGTASLISDFTAGNPGIEVVFFNDGQNQGRVIQLERMIKFALAREFEVIISFDADCVLDSNSVTELVRPLASDTSIDAVTGNIVLIPCPTVSKLLNTSVRAFYSLVTQVLRRGQSVLGTVSVIGGGFTAIRSSSLRRCVDEIMSSSMWKVGRDDNAIALTMLKYKMRLVFQATAIFRHPGAVSGRAWLHQHTRYQTDRHLKYRALFHLLRVQPVFVIGMGVVELLGFLLIRWPVLLLKKLLKFDGYRVGIGVYRWKV